jgi:hypothetical protein
MGQGGLEAQRTFGGYGVYAEKQLDKLQEVIDQAISELEKALNPSLILSLTFAGAGNIALVFWILNAVRSDLII